MYAHNCMLHNKWEQILNEIIYILANISRQQTKHGVNIVVLWCTFTPIFEYPIINAQIKIL